VGQILTGTTTARAADAVAWIQELSAAFSLPGLRRYGLSESEIPAAVAKAGKASSMKGNPVQLTEDELAHVLQQALD
jgi:alcohol dehydrogenase class IV